MSDGPTFFAFSLFTLTCFPNGAFPYPIKLGGMLKVCIALVTSLFSKFSKTFES
jgi:hypothetical protein